MLAYLGCHLSVNFIFLPVWGRHIPEAEGRLVQIPWKLFGFLRKTCEFRMTGCQLAGGRLQGQVQTGGKMEPKTFLQKENN